MSPGQYLYTKCTPNVIEDFLHVYVLTPKIRQEMKLELFETNEKYKIL